MSSTPSAVALPEPSADARAHSARLAEAIRAQIAAAGGTIPFSRWMELCLYTPGLGYYSAGATKFGAGGDFITAPELGPLFAQCVAQSVAPVLRALAADAVFFELGGGSGAFAEAALRHLAGLDALPVHYDILEPSADLRERQRTRLQAALPADLSGRVRWLDGPPTESWNGVLFANEVLDALPTPRFCMRDGAVFEQHVALAADGRFITVEQPADALLTAAVRHVERDLQSPFADGYRSELLPQLPYWIQAIGGLLQAGAMLFIDYGYPRREYYLPERRDGTLICHYRHRAHADPFLHPGLQDLTASVDFTALAEAGVNAGFDFAGYAAQAGFLLGNGLSQRVEALTDGGSDAEIYACSQQVKRLTLPGEMGERFQAMGFARGLRERGVEFADAFAHGDLSRRL